MSRELHDYQNAAIEQLREAIKGGSKRPLLQAPTGAGKTVIACQIIQNALEKGKRVYFCVPALVLVEQTFSDFFRQGIYSLGVIQARHAQTNASRQCQIISIQTLSRRRVAPPDIMIVDEAHRRDKHISALMRDPAWAHVIWIGLSATPWAKGLGKDYDRKITVTTTAELIGRGKLSPFRVFAPSHPDLTGVKIVAGDYQTDQLSAAMSRKKIVGDVVEHWLKLAECRPTLCFCVDRGHAQAVHESFKAAGVASAYQDGETDPEARKEIERQFRTGEIKVVCNIGTLTTGVDWDVRCIILARPTKSEMLYVQVVGRGLRTAEGKTDCLIIDHADATLNLGFVTDIHHDELDDGTGRGPADRTAPAERQEALPRACSACGILKSPRVHKCPACGHEPRRRDKTHVIDGQLYEVRRDGSRVKTVQNDARFWFKNLKRYETEKNYKTGWAANQFRAKFGAWPPRSYDHIALPDVIDPQVASWVRSRMIAYAKARQASAA